MRAATSIHFGQLARSLGDEVRRHGLVAPSFRSPPRRPGVDRAIRRVSGGAIVAVRVAGRPWVDVVADMVEGVVVTNGLTGVSADGWRLALRLLLAPLVDSLGADLPAVAVVAA